MGLIKEWTITKQPASLGLGDSAYLNYMKLIGTLLLTGSVKQNLEMVGSSLSLIQYVPTLRYRGTLSAISSNINTVGNRVNYRVFDKFYAWQFKDIGGDMLQEVLNSPKQYVKKGDLFLICDKGDSTTTRLQDNIDIIDYYPITNANSLDNAAGNIFLCRSLFTELPYADNPIWIGDNIINRNYLFIYTDEQANKVLDNRSKYV